MCGNGIRCVAKYVYDYGLTDKTQITIDTDSGIKTLDLTVENGKVSLVRVDMGAPRFEAELVPVIADSATVINQRKRIGDSFLSCRNRKDHCV
jgi:diaminopimelate epimerase